MPTEEAPMTLRDLGRQTEFKAGSGRESVTEFDAVYRRYLRPVYAFLAYRLDNRIIAEDLTSQVFEKAWRGLEGFDSRKSSLPTWLFTIARNCLTDYFRAQCNRPREVGLPPEFETGKTIDPLPPEQTQPGDTEPDRELAVRGDLRRALASLGNREREIVSLKFGAALTNRKIAQLLDITESNVGTILYRSLKKMKTQLEGGMQND